MSDHSTSEQATGMDANRVLQELTGQRRATFTGEIKWGTKVVGFTEEPEEEKGATEVQEADPELERLLDEEEQIARGKIPGMEYFRDPRKVISSAARKTGENMNKSEDMNTDGPLSDGFAEGQTISTRLVTAFRHKGREADLEYERGQLGITLRVKTVIWKGSERDGEDGGMGEGAYRGECVELFFDPHEWEQHLEQLRALG